MIRLSAAIIVAALVQLALSLHNTHQTSSRCLQSPGLNHHSCLSKAHSSRREFFLVVAGLTAGTLVSPSIAGADTPTSIPSCPKSVGNSKVNCASTAAVRQVDNYVAPWTYPSTMPLDEVMGRLKGVISTDIKLTISPTVDSFLASELILRAYKTRRSN